MFINSLYHTLYSLNEVILQYIPVETLITPPETTYMYLAFALGKKNLYTNCYRGGEGFTSVSCFSHDHMHNLLKHPVV